MGWSHGTMVDIRIGNFWAKAYLVLKRLFYLGLVQDFKEYIQLLQEGEYIYFCIGGHLKVRGDGKPDLSQNLPITGQKIWNEIVKHSWFANGETGRRPMEGPRTQQSLANYQKRVVRPKAEKDFGEAARFCMSYKGPIQPPLAFVRQPTIENSPNRAPTCIRP